MARRSRLVHCVAVATWLGACGASGADSDPVNGTFSAADRQFVVAAVAHYGSPRQASRAFANAGWRLLRANQPENALTVFDQALLVDPGYYDAHWGIGAVLQARGEIEKAIAAFERANRLPDVDEPNRAPLLSDLANLYALKAVLLGSEETARAEYFARANAMFEMATATDPANPQPWLQWVVGLYYEARYAEAWQKVATARGRGHEIPAAVLEPLRTKLAEPPR